MAAMPSAAAVRSSIERGDALAYRAERNLTLMRRDSDAAWEDRLLEDMAERDMQTDRVSSRELDVLRCLSFGMGAPGTADLLGISYSTVHTHIAHVKRKLRAKNECHAVATAIREGLIQ